MTSKNLAGWVIFTAIMSMVYEGVVIALRFVNVDKVNDYIGVFFIAVSLQLYVDILSRLEFSTVSLTSHTPFS